MSPECDPEESSFSRCFVRSTTVKVVVGQISQLSASFRLRLFRLTVVNTEPTFGEAEDHGKQQIPGDAPIMCGLGNTTCKASYEYGIKPVLDALWDITRSLTVTWEGCDTTDPIASNPQLCPVTMTRNRSVTVSWP